MVEIQGIRALEERTAKLVKTRAIFRDYPTLFSNLVDRLRNW